MWGAQLTLGAPEHCFCLLETNQLLRNAGHSCCLHRFIGKSEPAIIVALYFHLTTMLISAGPLAFGWPQPPQPLSWFDATVLLGVAAGSFLGQLFLTRGMQLENASLISSLNFSQVSNLRVWEDLLGL